jgi:hypothetical protein
MEFCVITGFGESIKSFRNDDHPTQIGQGMLQGSSSAAPLYNITSDVSLAAYKKMATGARFQHPINGTLIEDHATQCVDDKTETMNANGAGINLRQTLDERERAILFQLANTNTSIWTTMLWLSGGNLNTKKCFYYYIEPYFNHKKMAVEYRTKHETPGEITLKKPTTDQSIPLDRLETNKAR